jgi:hypothetical protein
MLESRKPVVGMCATMYIEHCALSAGSSCKLELVTDLVVLLGNLPFTMLWNNFPSGSTGESATAGACP